ncbi:MAG TPA: AMP-binding protein [Planctomycetaceae bacterium]|nr:AMP-binding protein [Planctomycetaceae bacterium]
MPHFLNELRSAFESHASRPALSYHDRIMTYGQLDAEARRWAARLQARGVEPGNRVALFTADKLPFLFAHLGVLYAGAIPLPLNPRFTREEMRYFLTDSEARMVIVGAEQRPLIETLASERTHPPLVQSDVDDSTAGTYREVAVRADDPCLILYSSGTTGWPKGVVHTHSGTAGSLRALQACWRMTADDVVLNVLPLFHIHGLAFATHLTWISGGCLRIEDVFEVERVLPAIGQSSAFMAVPPMYYRLLESAEFRHAAASWSQVRLFTCGSAPIRPEVLPELENILRHPVINRYGMTESYVITSLPLDGPWPSGSVGLPLEGIERRVIRGDGGNVAPGNVAPGEVGSVLIRGPHLFRQYWRKPEATKAALTDGWFDTGDLGSLDERGFLTLVGRKNDLIITSGYNVYPQVIERVLGECPGVQECAAFGIPDRERGERVAAAVVRSDPALDEARLRAWCSDRLVHYQQPRTLLFVDALPRNSLGKILRRELTANAEQQSN